MDELLQQWDRVDLAIKALSTAQLAQVSEKMKLLEQERAEMYVLIVREYRAFLDGDRKR